MSRALVPQVWPPTLTSSWRAGRQGAQTPGLRPGSACRPHCPLAAWPPASSRTSPASVYRMGVRVPAHRAAWELRGLSTWEAWTRPDAGERDPVLSWDCCHPPTGRRTLRASCRDSAERSGGSPRAGLMVTLQASQGQGRQNRSLKTTLQGHTQHLPRGGAGAGEDGCGEHPER